MCGTLSVGREAADRARDHVEPLALAELLALGEEELVAEADAEERARPLEARADRLDEPARLQIVHRVVEGAVAGQDHRLRVVDDHAGSSVTTAGMPEAREGLLHAARGCRCP